MSFRSRTVPAALLLAAAFGLAAPAASFAQPKFALSFPGRSRKRPSTGDCSCSSRRTATASRVSRSTTVRTPSWFSGSTSKAWPPDEEAVIDASAFGYPLRSLAELPTGEYYVQALLHRYETFHRSDGHVVKLPMDRGEGQRWNEAPGNLLSTPCRLRIDPGNLEMISARPRPGYPVDPRSQGHEIYPPRAHSKRSSDGVLGPAHAPRGLPAPA